VSSKQASKLGYSCLMQILVGKTENANSIREAKNRYNTSWLILRDEFHS